jgi:O-methyltransferase involved in polyketide biosynthesis
MGDANEHTITILFWEGIMPDKVTIDLGHVQKTMFLPLWGRAVETQKAHPLLVDKKAVEIIQKVDYDFAAMSANISPLSMFAWIKRSMFTDQVVRNFLKVHPNGTIVSIGCGMETTFERMDNGTLTWYDLDLPDTIELRKKFIPEGERRKFIAASFMDKEWPGLISSKDGVLLVAAGVLYYFSEEQVKAFFLRMADAFPSCELVLDVCSPVGVKIANKRVIESSGLDEKSYLNWGIKSPREILGWDARFKLLETFYYFKGKDVPKEIRFAGMISDAMKVQYMLHLRL